MRLEALFRPTSIAVVGASDKPTIGRRLIASLDRIGFAGQIFPINPNYSAVSGRQCYANIAELPETPDVAVFCVGHARVLDTLLAAAARGVRGAVIYDGGFAERGEDGRRLQAEIEGICRDAGIALCGLGRRQVAEAVGSSSHLTPRWSEGDAKSRSHRERKGRAKAAQGPSRENT